MIKTIQTFLVGITTVLLLTACGEKGQKASVAQPAPQAAVVLPPASPEPVSSPTATKIIVSDFADVAIKKSEYQGKEITFNCPMVLEAMGTFFCVPKDGGGLKVALDEKSIDPEMNALLIKNCTKVRNYCRGYVVGVLNVVDGRLIVKNAKPSIDIGFLTSP